MIWGLWYRQVEYIIDVKLGDSDTYSYKYEPMAELLAQWDTIKKYKHGKHCNDQWKHFSPFSISVDVILERVSLSYLCNLVKPWQRKGTNPYFTHEIG